MRFKAIATFAAAIAVAFCASSVSAEPTARQLELARRYFAAIHMDQLLATTLEAAVPMMMAENEKTSGLSPTRKAQMNEIIIEVLQGYMHKITDRYMPIIAETFTEAELTDLVAFYESPTGQSMIAKTPELTARMVPIIQASAPELREHLKARLCAKFGCPMTPPAAATPVS